ncbi:MAG: hypothetical protein A2445_01490 [Candidatus Jacksonbacteria bacterium RIFOXYC2_FULL_44_29]|nr:MAG: hypothetical protein UR94_C0005G0014 [Parcubacteria group bacterium GW2011_GWA2_36_10]KKT54129.1 MAG: hypothetical protein UW45_C0018G0015 [Parcubacteria group bacterium GW2011_GWC2_44_22]OGY75396.1 MAG: hypothetical protein A2295_05970 [Candidatus Jacksonbacteria bacterium RIFOXYB2_FULL_44_15]OGY76933.1 MAG: hypothetical protein A2240_01875 [Candidatus Jacksonbacteria bacterium RIFOXYA2_FULL_43_12]OGY77466.1 MAG: hypothetical protein A2445_01490 [Candidatus Jacksonbacteria bacterium RI
MTRNQKTVTIKTIKECFETILSADKNDSHLAARRVSKLLYSAQCGRDEYQDIKNLVNDAPREYDKIVEEWRQEDFVVSISVIYYLHDKEAQPDFLFPWLFQLLQHSNGVIRYAAVRMICNEIGPLTVHIRFPGDKFILKGMLKSEQADSILYSLFVYLNGLLIALWQPKYKRYKYVDSLPASKYKSAQMVFARMREDCGADYISRFSRYMAD